MDQDRKPKRQFSYGDRVLIAGPEPRRAGSVRFLDPKTGDVYVTVGDQEVKASPEELELDRRPRPRRVKFEVGEPVRVLEGPFANFEGVVEAVFPDRERLRVGIMIAGRITRTDVSFSEVAKK